MADRLCTSGHSSSAGARPRVLMVEDHADTARALAWLLRRLGHDVTVAHTAAAALECEDQEQFAVVVSDLRLPDASGCALLLALGMQRRRRGLSPLPGIALSGAGLESEVQQCHAAGFREHLLKPPDVGQLDRAIRRCALPQAYRHVPERPGTQVARHFSPWSLPLVAGWARFDSRRGTPASAQSVSKLPPHC